MDSEDSKDLVTSLSNGIYTLIINYDVDKRTGNLLLIDGTTFSSKSKHDIDGLEFVALMQRFVSSNADLIRFWIFF